MAVYNASLLDETKEIRRNVRIAIIVADFNENITHNLLKENKELLEKEGFTEVDVFHVPGAFELSGITSMLTRKGVYNLIITLGCIIKDQTPHFDYVCDSTTQGLTTVSIEGDTPIIFGVLTCDNLEQAQARINNNYAIYGLNYLSQRHSAETTADERYAVLVQQAGQIMGDNPEILEQFSA